MFCPGAGRVQAGISRRSASRVPRGRVAIAPGGRVRQDGLVPRSAPRHDRDAGGRPEDLAAKAALRDEVWSAMTAAHVARFPGAGGGIPTSPGAEAAAGLLRARPEWARARAIKSNPDSAQLPVRQRALEDGKTVYMAVPRLAEE